MAVRERGDRLAQLVVQREQLRQHQAEAPPACQRRFIRQAAVPLGKHELHLQGLEVARADCEREAKRAVVRLAAQRLVAVGRGRGVLQLCEAALEQRGEPREDRGALGAEDPRQLGAQRVGLQPALLLRRGLERKAWL